jgi:hypothetical protein
MMWERLNAAEARAHMALHVAARALAAKLRVAHNASAAACVRQWEEAEAQVCRTRQAETPSQHELEGGSARPPQSCENGSGSSLASAPQRKLKSAGCADNSCSSRQRSSACARAGWRKRRSARR